MFLINDTIRLTSRESFDIVYIPLLNFCCKNSHCFPVSTESPRSAMTSNTQKSALNIVMVSALPLVLACNYAFFNFSQLGGDDIWRTRKRWCQSSRHKGRRGDIGRLSLPWPHRGIWSNLPCQVIDEHCSQIDTARVYASGTSEEYLGKIDLASKGLKLETKLYPVKVRTTMMRWTILE